MLCFGGISFLAEIEEFGPIQPDSVGSALVAGRPFLRKLDIAAQPDFGPIAGDGLQIAQLGQVAFEAAEGDAGPLVVGARGVRVGERIGLRFRPEKLSLFDKASGRTVLTALYDGAAHV